MDGMDSGIADMLNRMDPKDREWLIDEVRAGGVIIAGSMDDLLAAARRIVEAGGA